MTIIELIKLIKPIPELFIRIHNIFCLEAFINGWHYRDTKEDVKARLIYFIINLKLKKRLWMNSLFYLIYFIKKLMEKNYGNVSDVLLKFQ